METLKLVTNPKWSLESMKNNGSTLISTTSHKKWKRLNQKCQIRTYYNGTEQLKKSKIKLPCLQNANPKPGPSVASLSLSLSLYKPKIICRESKLNIGNLKCLKTTKHTYVRLVPHLYIPVAVENSKLACEKVSQFVEKEWIWRVRLDLHGS